MRPSPDLRPRGWDALVVGVVLLAAAAISALFWTSSSQESLTAVVSIDGEEAERLPLAHPAVKTYTVGGYALTVEVTSEGVCVASSTCPTQDCVRTGVISRSGQSIVCLPARLSVVLVGGGSGVDAVIG